MEEYLSGLFMTPMKTASLKRNASPPEPPADSGAMKRGKTQESDSDCVIEPSQSLGGSSGIVSLESIVNGVSSSIDKLLDDKLKVIDEKISTVNGSLETMKSELQSLRVSQNQLDARQKKAEKRHEELGKMVENVRKDVKNQLEKAMEVFQNKEKEIEKKFDQSINMDRIRDLETTAQFMSKHFDSFKSTQSEVAENVRELKRMRVMTSEVRDGFELVREKVDTFESKQNALEKRLESAEQEFRRDARAVRDQLETATVSAHAHAQRPPISHSLSAGRTDESRGGVTLREVRDLILEQQQQSAIKNNVIVSPLPEMQSEDLRAVLLEMIPELAEHDFDAIRIGRAPEAPGSEANKPRLVRIQTTEAAKRLLMRKRGLKHGETPVYVNHDLTFAERSRRKQLLPVFRSLRQAKVQCSLTRDRIIRDGKEMSDTDIQAALSA